MKLELKRLAPYLPYGLNVIEEEIGEKFQVAGFNVSNNEFLIHDNIEGSIEEYSVNLLKPILRPLSDLTKEIEVNGEKFVPAFRTQLHLDKSLPLLHHGRILLENRIITNTISYSDMQFLISLHFDVFNLIENNLAIDINTLNK